MNRHAASVRPLRHDQMEQGPTEPHAGRGTFVLSSGGAGSGYYRGAFGTGPIPTENQFPWQTLVACLPAYEPSHRNGEAQKAQGGTGLTEDHNARDTSSA